MAGPEAKAGIKHEDYVENALNNFRSTEADQWLGALGYDVKTIKKLKSLDKPNNKKEETFHVLYGKIKLELNGKARICTPGDVVTILPKVRHTFSSEYGAVIEEISSSHYQEDSYYTDPKIMKNKNRKTLLSYWME